MDSVYKKAFQYLGTIRIRVLLCKTESKFYEWLLTFYWWTWPKLPCIRLWTVEGMLDYFSFLNSWFWKIVSIKHPYLLLSREMLTKCQLEDLIQPQRLDQPPEKSVSTVLIHSQNWLPFLNQTFNCHAWSYCSYLNLSVTSEILLPQNILHFTNHI